MKKCKIIGFGKVVTKEENKEMLRIIIGINSISENYYGTMVTAVFLDYDKNLEKDLEFAIDNDIECEYTTTDNIMTGKTKVNKIIVKYE